MSRRVAWMARIMYAIDTTPPAAKSVVNVNTSQNHHGTIADHVLKSGGGLGGGADGGQTTSV